MDKKTLRKILVLVVIAVSLIGIFPLGSAVDYNLSISVVGGGQANPAFGLYFANDTLIGTFNTYSESLPEGTQLKLYPYPASYYEIDYLVVNSQTFYFDPVDMPYVFTLDVAKTIEIHFVMPEPTPTPEPTATPTPAPSPTPAPDPVDDGVGGSSSADWVYMGKEGSWDTVWYPDFEDVSFNFERASAKFVYNGSVGVIGDSEGFNLNFTVNTLRGDRNQWYWLNGVKRFVAVLELRKGSDVAYSWLYLAHEQGVFYETARAHFGSKFWLMSTAPELNGGVYDLRVFREGDVKAIGAFGLKDNGWESTTLTTWNIGGSENFTVSADFWDNPTVTLYVYQEGVGAVDVVFDGVFVGEMGFVYSQGKDNSPDWLKAISGFFNFVGTLASTVVRFILSMLPLFEFLFLGWLIDAVIASVMEGSIQPVGKVFSIILEVLGQLWEGIVGFFSAVGEFIPF